MLDKSFQDVVEEKVSKNPDNVYELTSYLIHKGATAESGIANIISHYHFILLYALIL